MNVNDDKPDAGAVAFSCSSLARPRMSPKPQDARDTKMEAELGCVGVACGTLMIRSKKLP